MADRAMEIPNHRFLGIFMVPEILKANWVSNDLFVRTSVIED